MVGACSEPERPTDIDTVYEERCPACCIKAGLDLLENGDRQMWDMDDEEEPDMWLSEIAAGARLGLVSDDHV